MGNWRRFAASGIVGLVLLPLSAATTAPALASNDFCARIGHVAASTGARMYCDFRASQQAGAPRPKAATAPAKTPPEHNDQGSPRQFGTNVNSANPQEDQFAVPSGAQAYGQSETSIAAAGPYVVEAWNDATSFFAPCGLPYSPPFKEEATGYGFSADGGRSFTDMGGLPNDCTSGFQLFGDPSVEVWQRGGTTYFYVSSLYISLVTGQSDVAINACAAAGNTLACNRPVLVATGGPGDFLDKEFLSIDPSRSRLYSSYTRYNGDPASPNFQGQIELAACDISSPGTPVCSPGPSPVPYFVVQPGQPCQNEGSYPAVHVGSGDVYVAWEYNLQTNLGPPFGPTDCQTLPVQNKVAYVPIACLAVQPVSPCGTTPKQQAVNITSIDVARVPGYNRILQFPFPGIQDFPRIAVSQPAGTVSIAWNDARRIPTADILLQSFNLVSLTPVQDAPIRLNADAGSMWNILPALRNAGGDGKLNVTWYQQREPGALTDVMAAVGFDPRTEDTPRNVRVTTEPTGWLDVSSNIIPNFGDYTDNYVLATPNSPYTDQTLFVAWSDGRLGLPQPFSSRLSPGDGR
jgi:hypothetical protein